MFVPCVLSTNFGREGDRVRSLTSGRVRRRDVLVSSSLKSQVVKVYSPLNLAESEGKDLPYSKIGRVRK
jgi:hypothetical protein